MMWLLQCVFILSLCGLYTSGRNLGLFLDDVCKEEEGNEWICTKLNDCPKAKKIYESGAMPKPETCGFIGFDPIVCCEPVEELTSKYSPEHGGLRKTKSQTKCDEYAKAVYVENRISFVSSGKKENTCAAVAEPLIVGGMDAVAREYPHMALIGYGNKDSIQYNCGGSLISERYILSAAHCTDGGSNGLAKWVLLGDYNIHSTEDELHQNSSPELYEIIERINHPEYKPPRLYNDIALYKLHKDVTFNSYIRPCCINYNPEKSYKAAIATGWGHTEWSGKGSDILQKVTLNITDIIKCNNSYKHGSQSPSGIVSQLMLCAGDTTDVGQPKEGEKGKLSKDTCQGDSGGPLQILLKKPYCMYSVLGITSYGSGCGTPIPAIYTRVSNFIPWIESVVWPS